MINKCIKIYIKNKEVINYLIFGVLTTVVSLLVYYLLTFTILDANKPVENNNIKKELSSFVGARIITLIMDMLIMYIGVTIFKGNDKVIKIISQIIVIVSNYLFSKIFVFKKNSTNL